MIRGFISQITYVSTRIIFHYLIIPAIYWQKTVIKIFICVLTVLFGFSLTDGIEFSRSCQIHGPSAVTFGSLLTQELSPSEVNNADESNKSPLMNNPAFLHSSCPPAMHKSCFCVRLIAEHTKMLEDSTKVIIF